MKSLLAVARSDKLPVRYSFAAVTAEKMRVSLPTQSSWAERPDWCPLKRCVRIDGGDDTILADRGPEDAAARTH